jgi:23S rRNA (uracil1939-C5)-methyltransferase
MTDAPDIIQRLAAKGDGVTGDGRYFAMTAPGDRIADDGTVVPGPHHADPACRHYPACGGCQIQHVDEASFAGFVRDRVAGAIAGQGLTAGTVLPPHISPPGSRRRASLRAIRAGGGVRIGFSTEQSHHVVDMTMCAILHPALFALVAPLRELLPDMIADRQGAHVKMTLTDQGVDLLIEGVTTDSLAQAEALIAFAQAHGLARLSVDDGYGPQTRWEPEPVTVTFGGVPVAFPPYAFLQATQDGEAALLDAARPAIADARVFADLFTGLGTFALGLGNGRGAYAAEAARDHILALKAAGARAGRKLAADHRDLFRRPLTAQELDRFDAILLDPPRAGAREQAAQLAQSWVPAIAYVSCNPGSFARDAKMLVEGGYTLESVKPVGQFRWSTHVELAAVFRR